MHKNYELVCNFHFPLRLFVSCLSCALPPASHLERLMPGSACCAVLRLMCQSTCRLPCASFAFGLGTSAYSLA